MLKDVPFFALFDDDELTLLASQVDLRTFAPRQRIYKIGDRAGRAYVLLSGAVRVTTIDEDQQDVVFDQPASGDLFGFASLLDQTPHQTTAVALEESVCIQVERDDIFTLVQKKPHAAIDMMAVLGRRLHAAQALIRGRSARNPNVLIETDATFGERLADVVAAFGGSWAFIVLTGALLIAYCAINLRLGGRAWDPYPFILLNLILSMLAAIQAPVIMMSQTVRTRTIGFAANSISTSIAAPRPKYRRWRQSSRCSCRRSPTWRTNCASEIHEQSVNNSLPNTG
jgi:CRP-like cAMP-binding protein